MGRRRQETPRIADAPVRLPLQLRAMAACTVGGIHLAAQRLHIRIVRLQTRALRCLLATGSKQGQGEQQGKPAGNRHGPIFASLRLPVPKKKGAPKDAKLIESP